MKASQLIGKNQVFEIHLSTMGSKLCLANYKGKVGVVECAKWRKHPQHKKAILWSFELGADMMRRAMMSVADKTFVSADASGKLSLTKIK